MQRTEAIYNHLIAHARRGEGLPSEAALQREFQLSRSAVREVLAQLVAKGVLLKSKGRATQLINPMESLIAALPLNADPNIEQIREVLEFRAFLEGSAASACARSATDLQLQLIDQEYQRMRDRNRGATTLAKAKADLQFHMLIAKYSHNLVIASLSELFYNRYFAAIYKALDLTLKRYGRYPERIGGQHQAIQTALLARDPGKSEEAAREHVLYTRSLLDGMR